MKLGIVVGHNRRKTGAEVVAPINQNEFDFNSEVAALMKAAAADHGLEAEVFFRPAGLAYGQEIRAVYAEVDQWGARATTELHFNSFNTSVVGTETLSSGSAKSMALAEATQTELVALFQRSGRADRGVKILQRDDRGGLSLWTSRAPSILVEPFFGDSPQEAELMHHIGKQALADAYLRGAAAVAGRM